MAGPNRRIARSRAHPPKSGCQSRSSRAAFVTSPTEPSAGVQHHHAGEAEARASQSARRLGSSIHSKSILCARPRMRRMIFAAANPRVSRTAGAYRPAVRLRGAPRRPGRRKALRDRRRRGLRCARVDKLRENSVHTSRSSPASSPRTNAAPRASARGRLRPESPDEIADHRADIEAHRAVEGEFGIDHLRSLSVAMIDPVWRSPWIRAPECPGI